MDLSKFMEIKTLVMLVFKPVFMVLSLSVILVILVLIKWIISPPGNKVWQVLLQDHWNLTIETVWHAAWNNSNLYDSKIKSEGIMEFSIVWVKNTFADIIVYLFGLFLMYFLVRMVVSIQTGIWFIDNAMTNTFKSLENILINLPIIPVAWWIGISAAKSADTSLAATRLAGIDFLWQQTRINKLLWLWTSFSNLHPDLDRDEFISRSVQIARWLNMTSIELQNNNEFLKKIQEWNHAENRRKWQGANHISYVEIQESLQWKSDNQSNTQSNQQSNESTN